MSLLHYHDLHEYLAIRGAAGYAPPRLLFARRDRDGRSLILGTNDGGRAWSEVFWMDWHVGPGNGFLTEHPSGDEYMLVSEGVFAYLTGAVMCDADGPIAMRCQCQLCRAERLQEDVPCPRCCGDLLCVGLEVARQVPTECMRCGGLTVLERLAGEKLSARPVDSFPAMRLRGQVWLVPFALEAVNAGDVVGVVAFK